MSEREKLQAALTEYLSAELGDTYDCTRVWEAWSVGTMTDDDFEPVSDRLSSIVLDLMTVIERNGALPPAAPSDGAIYAAVSRGNVSDEVVDAVLSDARAAAPSGDREAVARSCGFRSYGRVDCTCGAAHPPAISAEERGVPDDLEEALRLCEVGEYLYSARAYSYGDGQTEPREYGIDWQWQQSKPGEYGQGVLLAEAVKWHEQQAADGFVTEAAKLRAALSRARAASAGGTEG